VHVRFASTSTLLYDVIENDISLAMPNFASAAHFCTYVPKARFFSPEILAPPINTYKRVAPHMNIDQNNHSFFTIWSSE
jgi:hypothetical protein